MKTEITKDLNVQQNADRKLQRGTIVEMRTGLRNSIMLQKTETMKSGWTIRILILLTKKSLEKRLKNITKLDAQIAKSRII